MEFLVIVLFVVAIVVVNFLVVRAQRRKGRASGDAPATEGTGQDKQATARPQKSPRKAAGAKAAPAGPRTSAEAAREANARLDAAQHQLVYAAIAQGRPLVAVKLYAQFTGVGVRAAAVAVENLAMHPQPFQPPRATSTEPNGSGAAGSAPARSGTAGSDPAPEAGTTGSPVPDAADRERPVPTDSGPTDSARTDSAPTGSTPTDSTLTGSAKNPTGRGDDAPETGAPSTSGAAGTAADADPDNTSGPRDSAAPSDKTKGPAGRNPSTPKKPSTPEEDEISKWVKNLRPEDF